MNEGKHKLPDPSSRKFSRGGATALLRTFGDPAEVGRAAAANKKRELFKWYCLKKLGEQLRRMDAERRGTFRRASVADRSSAQLPPGGDTSVADGFVELLRAQSDPPDGPDAAARRAGGVDRDTFLGELQRHITEGFTMGESLWVALDRRNLGVISLVSFHAALHVAVVTDAADPVETLCALFRIHAASRPSNTLTVSELAMFKGIFSTAASTYDERVKMSNLVEMAFRWTMQTTLLMPEKDFAQLVAVLSGDEESGAAAVEKKDKDKGDADAEAEGTEASVVPRALPLEDAEDLPITEAHFRAVLAQLPDMPRIFHESLRARLGSAGHAAGSSSG